MHEANLFEYVKLNNRLSFKISMSTVLSQLKYLIYYSLSTHYKNGTYYGYKNTVIIPFISL